MEKIYTIGEASEELGMPASTLRYYDKRGLFPDVARSRGGMRVYTEDDLEWARFIERLKASGMPIAEIKEYINLYRAGDSTIERRREIVHERRNEIDGQVKELKNARDFIDYKCWFYDVAAESGTCDTPRNMPRRTFRRRSRASRRGAASTGTRDTGNETLRESPRPQGETSPAISPRISHACSFTIAKIKQTEWHLGNG